MDFHSVSRIMTAKNSRAVTRDGTVCKVFKCCFCLSKARFSSNYSYAFWQHVDLSGNCECSHTKERSLRKRTVRCSIHRCCNRHIFLSLSGPTTLGIGCSQALAVSEAKRRFKRVAAPWRVASAASGDRSLVTV